MQKPEVHKINPYLKMTINEVLECYNETLKQLRLEKKLENGGHFVFYQYYDKKIGNYYTYHMKIEYVHNATNGIFPAVIAINPFVSLDKTVQIQNNLGEKEKAEKEMHKSILILFLTQIMQPDTMNSLIEGTYGTE